MTSQRSVRAWLARALGAGLIAIFVTTFAGTALAQSAPGNGNGNGNANGAANGNGANAGVPNSNANGNALGRAARDKPKKDLSDLNKDGVIDRHDLILFVARHPYLDFNQDWCSWIADYPIYQKHYARLIAFIADYYDCGDAYNPLIVLNELISPTNITRGPHGEIFVSDPKVGSVFLLDTQYQPTAEFKGFELPLGIVCDDDGNLFVGDQGRGVVEKYDGEGTLLLTFGAGLVRKPTDLDLDADGNVYVCDADSSVVWVFGADGTHIRTIRKGGLDYPVRALVAYRTDDAGTEIGEVYVADKGHYRIVVYDLAGNMVRQFGGFPTKSGWFRPTWHWEGKFIALQGLAMDAEGALHVLDAYMQKIQILNPLTGAYQSYYGTVGDGAQEFMQPMDLLFFSDGSTVVSDAKLARVEVIQ